MHGETINGIVYSMDCRIIIFVVEKIEFYMSCKTTAHMSIPGVNIELNVG